MNKSLFYCLPTYKSFDLAYASVLAALKGTLVPDQIIIIDNSGDGSGTQYLKPLTEQFDNVFIWPQIYNIGVAKSWNTFHKQLCDDYIVIANDDIQVHSRTLELMVSTAENNPNHVLFAGDGSSGNAFSLFLLTKRGYQLVGEFDEHFYPAYLEDNDFDRRARLLGQYIHFVIGATYDHVGSSTIKRYTPQEMDVHHNSFRANQAYYIRKHGGLPHQEIFETPFDQ